MSIDSTGTTTLVRLLRLRKPTRVRASKLSLRPRAAQPHPLHPRANAALQALRVDQRRHATACRVSAGVRRLGRRRPRLPRERPRRYAAARARGAHHREQQPQQRHRPVLAAARSLHPVQRRRPAPYPSRGAYVAQVEAAVARAVAAGFSCRPTLTRRSPRRALRTSRQPHPQRPRGWTPSPRTTAAPRAARGPTACDGRCGKRSVARAGAARDRGRFPAPHRGGDVRCGHAWRWCHRLAARPQLHRDARAGALCPSASGAAHRGVPLAEDACRVRPVHPRVQVVVLGHARLMAVHRTVQRLAGQRRPLGDERRRDEVLHAEQRQPAAATGPVEQDLRPRRSTVPSTKAGLT